MSWASGVLRGDTQVNITQQTYLRELVETRLVGRVRPEYSVRVVGTHLMSFQYPPYSQLLER